MRRIFGHGDTISSLLRRIDQWKDDSRRAKVQRKFDHRFVALGNPHERKALGFRRRRYHGMKAFRTDGRVFLINHHRVGSCAGERLRNDGRRNNVDK